MQNLANDHDQVPRLEAFRADHPDIEIKSPLETRSAFWRARRDGEQLAVGPDLRRLLDALDAKLGEEGSGHGAMGPE